MTSLTKFSDAILRPLIASGPISLAGRLLSRVRRWHRDDFSETEVALRPGGKMLVNRSETTNVFVWAFAMWEPAITAILRKVVKPGDVFFDIGAHLGYFSIVAAQLGATPVAIEPSPPLLQRLRKNFEINAIDVDLVLPVAISEEKGVTRFFGGPKNNTGKGSLISSWAEHETQFDVQTDTLDAAAQWFDAVTCVKIDVEGVEAVILRQLLDRVSRMPRLATILFELHPKAKLESLDVVTAFVSGGFRLFEVENEYKARFYRRKTWRIRELSLAQMAASSAPDYALSRLPLADLFPPPLPDGAALIRDSDLAPR